jgi:hypothetical protein
MNKGLTNGHNILSQHCPTLLHESQCCVRLTTHVISCWTMLDDVGQCCVKFDFSHKDTAFGTISNVAVVWPFEHNIFCRISVFQISSSMYLHIILRYLHWLLLKANFRTAFNKVQIPKSGTVMPLKSESDKDPPVVWGSLVTVCWTL